MMQWLPLRWYCFFLSPLAIRPCRGYLRILTRSLPSCADVFFEGALEFHTGFDGSTWPTSGGDDATVTSSSIGLAISPLGSVAPCFPWSQVVPLSSLKSPLASDVFGSLWWSLSGRVGDFPAVAWLGG